MLSRKVLSWMACVALVATQASAVQAESTRPIMPSISKSDRAEAAKSTTAGSLKRAVGKQTRKAGVTPASVADPSWPLVAYNQSIELISDSFGYGSTLLWTEIFTNNGTTPIAPTATNPEGFAVVAGPYGPVAGNTTVASSAVCDATAGSSCPTAPWSDPNVTNPYYGLSGGTLAPGGSITIQFQTVTSGWDLTECDVPHTLDVVDYSSFNWDTVNSSYMYTYFPTPVCRQLNLDTFSNPYKVDGIADMVAVTTAGELKLYTGTSAGYYANGQTLGTGWQYFTSIVSPGDSDGYDGADIWARASDGSLYQYVFWEGSVYYDRLIGTGWNGISAMTAAGDVNGDGSPDLYGRATNGDLWLYYGQKGGGIGGQMRVGTGWNGLDVLLGGFDATGDGLNDVIGRDIKTGSLRLYPANSSGALTGSGPVVGNGWGAFNILTTMSSPAQGTVLLGRLANGTLLSYNVSKTGTITGPRTIGTGWNGIKSIW